MLWGKAASLAPAVWLIFLTGCAGIPAHQAAADRSVPSVPPPGYGTLVMCAPEKRWEGGATIFIDDVPAFKLHAHEYTWIYVRGGQHTFRTQWGHGLDHLNSKGHIRVATATVCYLELDQSANPASAMKLHAGIRTIPIETARDEISGLSYRPPLVTQLDTAGIGK